MQGIFHVNQHAVIAMTPADFPDHWVILAIEHEPQHGTPYVTALVSQAQLPDPDQWWNGHYFTSMEQAVEDYHKRASTDFREFLRIARDLEATHVFRCRTCHAADREVTVVTTYPDGVTSKQAHMAHRGFGVGVGTHKAEDFEAVEQEKGKSA